MVLTSRESAVSSVLYSTATLTFNLFTPNCEAFISVPLCIVDVHLVKLCQTLCKISCQQCFGTHTDGCKHARMNRQNHHAAGHITLVELGGITISNICSHYTIII